MDSFESVVAAILQRQGFWTMTSVKVELTKAEKRAIGKHSTPRWELDVVGYNARDNELRVIECKSFLNSRGVDCKVFDGTNKKGQKRYKLFCDDTLRKVVLRRLKRQFVRAGFCSKQPWVRLGLAAGRICGDAAWLESHFQKKKWLLWSPKTIRAALEDLSESGYENSVAAVVTKLLKSPKKRSAIKGGVDASADGDE